MHDSEYVAKYKTADGCKPKEKLDKKIELEIPS